MGKKLYKCDLKGCEKLCSSKFSLKRHNMKHTDQKKFICKHCQKAFVLPQYLEEHQYTHTGEKPFVCGINGCPETFRQRGKLSIHRKNLHPDAPLNAPTGIFGDGAIFQTSSNPGMRGGLIGSIEQYEEEKEGPQAHYQQQNSFYALKQQQAGAGAGQIMHDQYHQNNSQNTQQQRHGQQSIHQNNQMNYQYLSGLNGNDFAIMSATREAQDKQGRLNHSNSFHMTGNQIEGRPNGGGITSQMRESQQQIHHIKQEKAPQYHYQEDNSHQIAEFQNSQIQRQQQYQRMSNAGALIQDQEKAEGLIYHQSQMGIQKQMRPTSNGYSNIKQEQHQQQIILQQMGLSLDNAQSLVIQHQENNNLLGKIPNHILISEDQLGLHQNGGGLQIAFDYNIGSNHNLSNTGSVHSTKEAPSRLNSQNRSSMYPGDLNPESQNMMRMQNFGEVAEFRQQAGNKSSFYQKNVQKVQRNQQNNENFLRGYQQTNNQQWQQENIVKQEVQGNHPITQHNIRSQQSQPFAGYQGMQQDDFVPQNLPKMSSFSSQQSFAAHQPQQIQYANNPSAADYHYINHANLSFQTIQELSHHDLASLKRENLLIQGITEDDLKTFILKFYPWLQHGSKQQPPTAAPEQQRARPMAAGGVQQVYSDEYAQQIIKQRRQQSTNNPYLMNMQ